MIASIFNLFGSPKQEKAGKVAKQRLSLLLFQDRINLPPEQMDALKRDLLEVISKYVEIEKTNIEINFENIPESRTMAKMAITSNVQTS